MRTEQQDPTETTTENRSSAQLQEDIRHTRRDMDRTIHELGERLDPRNLLDDVLDLFQGDDRGSTGQRVASTLRSGANAAREVIREHPVPSLLCAAGVAWWLTEPGSANGTTDNQDTDPFLDVEPVYPAWHDEYEWSATLDETPDAWRARADRSLHDIQASFADTSVQPTDRIRETAATLLDLSRQAPETIRARYTRSHTSHNGGHRSEDADWQHLADCEALASGSSDPDDESWSERAAEVWDALKVTLADASTSANEKLQKTAATLSDYARDTGASSAAMATAAANRARAIGGSAQARVAEAGDAARAGASSAARRVARRATAMQAQLTRSGHTATRQVSVAMDDYPLAVAAACFGVGLLVGLGVPPSRREDAWLGDLSDDLKDTVADTATDTLAEGQRVAAETASAAMDAAERKGLTPERLGASAREAAQTATESVRQVARDVAAHAKDAADTGEVDASTQAKPRPRATTR